MNTDCTGKLIFASSEWLDQFHSELQQIASEHPDFNYSNCTVLTNVPKELNPDASGHIAYMFEIKDGVARFERREVAETEVDLKAISDYQRTLPLARMHYDLSSASCMAEVQALQTSLVEAGHMIAYLNREFSGATAEIGAELHNRIAAFTA